MLFGNSKAPQEESRDMFHLERTGTNIMNARKNGLSDIVSLAPFLSGGVLSQIAGELLRTGTLTDIPPAALFGQPHHRSLSGKQALTPAFPAQGQGDCPSGGCGGLSLPPRPALRAAFSPGENAF